MAELQKPKGSKTKLPPIGVIAGRKALANIKEPATRWPWFAWYFQQEVAKWTH